MKIFVLSLTLFRIISGPLIFGIVIFLESNLLALFIFIAASLSDYFDGKLARNYKVETALGAVLDPIADKILILFTLFAITIITKDPFVGMMSSLILAREFWVSALREYAALNSNNHLTRVSFLAKVKTFIQFITIIMFFLALALKSPLGLFLSKFLLLLALLITLKTAIDYSKNFKFL